MELVEDFTKGSRPEEIDGIADEKLVYKIEGYCETTKGESSKEVEKKIK
jgi:hypothetical protein